MPQRERGTGSAGEAGEEGGVEGVAGPAEEAFRGGPQGAEVRHTISLRPVLVRST